MAQSPAAVLDPLEARLHEVRARMGRLSFEQFVSKRPQPGRAELEAEEAAILRDPRVEEAIARPVADPLLARRLDLWRRAGLQAMVSGDPEIMAVRRELADELVAARYEVAGRTLDLGAVRDLLRKEPDPEVRRRAWLAVGPLSRALAGRLRRLMHLRNDRARQRGYRGYADLALDLQGLSRATVEAVLLQLRDATDEALTGLLGGSTAAPWDVSYLLEGRAAPPPGLFPRSKMLARLYAWARRHGMEPADTGIAVHFVDIPYNGLSMAIDPPRDVRVLLNPGDGHLYYKLLWHEYGHALHATFNAQATEMLRREPSIWNEAMAESLAFFTLEPAWVQACGATAAEAEDVIAAGLGAWLIWLRTRSAYALFEYRAYDDPAGDLDGLYASMEARFLHCSVDPSPRWAANAWFTNYPVYWQNYVLADAIAAQIHGAMRAQLGRVEGNPEAIAFLRERCWASGASVEWSDKLAAATGRGLDAADLIRRVTAPAGMIGEEGG